MVQIPKGTFERILMAVGYPFVTVAPDEATDTKGYDLEITSKQIKDLIVEPSLQEYFRWFPLEEVETYSVASNFEIPFPNENVFSVKDVRINTNRGSSGMITGNAFIDARNITQGVSRGMYGTRYDYGFTTANQMVRSEMQTIVNSNKAFKWRVLENQRVLKGFTNVAGTIEVTWASRSSNWDNVAFSQQSDVTKLCQAKLLDYIGRLRQQANVNDAPIDLDADILIERAKELNESVYEKWKNFVHPVIVR